MDSQEAVTQVKKWDDRDDDWMSHDHVLLIDLS